MKKVVLMLACIFFIFIEGASFAGVFIIGNSKLKFDSLTKAQVKKIYLGKLTSLGGADIKLADCDSIQKEFLGTFLGKSIKVYRKGWIKKVFAEGVTPPVKFETVEDVLDFVQNTPYAIGYVSESPSGGKVKVLVK